MSSSKERPEGSVLRESGRKGGSQKDGETEMESFTSVGCQWYANMTFTSEETTSSK